ncbi:MAG: hypothetical protein K8I30_02575 [Anaerolineae bacterium]|nr:hypothetical protein [Anaerolineae bacterium]
MAAQSTITRAPSANLLRNALRANGVFSTVSGIIFIVGAGQVASFVGVDGASNLFLVMGVLILGFAAILIQQSTRPALDTRLGWLVFALDVMWVVISWVILAADAFGLSTEGRWAVLILADIVAVFAVLEFIGLRRLTRA